MKKSKWWEVHIRSIKEFTHLPLRDGWRIAFRCRSKKRAYELFNCLKGGRDLKSVRLVELKAI